MLAVFQEPEYLVQGAGSQTAGSRARAGFQASLAVRMALLNLCIWLNGQCDQPRLAVANSIES